MLCLQVQAHHGIVQTAENYGCKLQVASRIKGNPADSVSGDASIRPSSEDGELEDYPDGEREEDY